MRMRFVVCGLILGVAVSATAATEQALFDAIRSGNRQAVRAMLAKKADVNMTTADGTTPLMVAAERKDDQAASLLLTRAPTRARRTGTG